ncbi:uncharacterized protein LOC144177697 isoform X2 [Haemaphysalis longicornis]
MESGALTATSVQCEVLIRNSDGFNQPSFIHRSSTEVAARNNCQRMQVTQPLDSSERVFSALQTAYPDFKGAESSWAGEPFGRNATPLPFPARIRRPKL